MYHWFYRYSTHRFDSCLRHPIFWLSIIFMLVAWNTTCHSLLPLLTSLNEYTARHFPKHPNAEHRYTIVESNKSQMVHFAICWNNPIHILLTDNQYNGINSRTYYGINKYGIKLLNKPSSLLFNLKFENSCAVMSRWNIAFENYMKSFLPAFFGLIGFKRIFIILACDGGAVVVELSLSLSLSLTWTIVVRLQSLHDLFDDKLVLVCLQSRD